MTSLVKYRNPGYPGQGWDGGRPHFSREIDFSLAAWNTVATHEVFTVTGLVRLMWAIECTVTLTDAADLATIGFGTESDPDGLTGALNAAGAGGGTISAGQVLNWDANAFQAPANGFFADKSSSDSPDSIAFQRGLVNGKDLGFQVAGGALTGGKLVLHLWWSPVSADGSLAHGTGSTL